MASTIARGPHGSYVPGSGRGDVTGRTYLSNADAKIKREEALKATRNALIDEPCITVAVPGGKTYLVPKAAHAEIIAQAEAAAAEEQGGW